VLFRNLFYRDIGLDISADYIYGKDNERGFLQKAAGLFFVIYDYPYIGFFFGYKQDEVSRENRKKESADDQKNIQSSPSGI